MPKLGLGLSLPQTRVAGGFTPKKLSGLSLWLKADAGVTLSGSNVTAWVDQSGNGNNATPVDVNPTFNSSDLNGKPTITLSSIAVGDNESLSLDSSPMGASGTTAFVVNYVDPDVFGSDANGALLGNFGSAENGSHWPYGLTNSVYDSFATDTRKDDLGLPDGITSWNIYSVHSQDDDYKLFCNGIQFHSDVSNVYSNTIGGNGTLYIGMQNNAGTDQIFKGKVAEVVIYNRVLTTPERQQVEAYLIDKYAIDTSITTSRAFNSTGGEVASTTGDIPVDWVRSEATITSVTFANDNSVTSIGSYAFYQCTNLSSITIPNSVTIIGDYAFSNCTSLSAATIGNSVTSIGNNAFTSASFISITIPNSVTIIGDYAFNSCANLTTINIPNGVTSIGIHTFEDCASLSSITIPNSVTSIGSYAFAYAGLTSITIPNSVTSLGDSSFRNCTSLATATIGNSVTSIGSYAFSSTDLTSITIPNSVTSIGNSAFYGCFSLTGTLTIPNSVTSIGDSAFNSTSLTTATIGTGVTSIASAAFRQCSNLTSVTFTATSGVTSIGSDAFYQCTSLATITIPNNVTDIGSGAFYNCSSLTSITIPNSVTNIGTAVFYGCSNLATVLCYVAQSVFTGSNAFYGTASPLVIQARITDASWTAGVGLTFQGNSDVTVIKNL